MASIGMYILKNELRIFKRLAQSRRRNSFSYIYMVFKKWIAVKEFNLWEDLQRDEINIWRTDVPNPDSLSAISI